MAKRSHRISTPHARARRDRDAVKRTRQASGLKMESLEPRAMLAGEGFVASSANPGEAEAISLYLVNQIRHAPQTWATLANIDLSRDYLGRTVNDLYGNPADLTPKDSLIYDDTLAATAANYSSILVTHGGLDHFYADAAGNTRPSTRAANYGYTGGNVTENLAYNMVGSAASITSEQKAAALVEQLFIDVGVAGAGHRMNILMADHSEVGFGFARGASGYTGYDNFYTTQNFGTESGAASKPWLTGFVLANTDGNQQFNQGEGLSGVTITIVDTTTATTSTTTTGTYGYWDFPAVSGHTYTVSASGGSFVGTATATGVAIAAGGSNGFNTRTIDFFSAAAGSKARVDFGVPENQAATGAVTIGGELVIGATLTVNTSGISDADGKGTFRYKWFVDGVELTDAFANGSVSTNSGTLKLTEALSPNVLLAVDGSAAGPFLDGMLLGHKFSVVVTYTDQAGALEALMSAETAAVGDMTVAQALARLTDTSIERISITDTGEHLIDFATTLNGAANKSVYGKIKEFHLSDSIVTNVADAKKLSMAIGQVKAFNDCFSYAWWRSPGASLSVEDTAENIAAAGFDGEARFALSNDSIVSTVKVTGGSISASGLVYAIDSYRATRKAGATVTVTGNLDALPTADRAKVIAFLGDVTPPAFVSAAQNVGSTSLVLSFSESLDGVAPSATAFDVVVNGTHQQPVSTSISGSTVVLTLAAAASSGDSVTVSYAAPGTGAIKDLSGNAAAAIPAAPVSVQSTPPVFQSVSTSADGMKIILTYDKALSATTPLPAAFTVEVYDSGTWAIPLPRSVSTVAVSGSTVELTLDKPVNNRRNKVWLTYADPTSGNDVNAIQETTGIDAARLSRRAVTNSVTLATTWLGTSGSDPWSGGAGNDEAYANLGSDTLVGNAGNDILDLGYYANSSGTSLSDTSSNTASGGDGNDEIYGTAGVDTLQGDAGDDLLYSSGSNDSLDGGSGDDQLFGRGGNDTLTGGSGNDELDGGDGSADVAVFSLGRSAYTVSQSGSTYTVSAKTGTDATDKVTAVEIYRFADGDVAVANILAGNVVAASLGRTGAAFVAAASTYGTASAATSTTIAGSNLSGNLTATAPGGFEVSTDGSTWGSTALLATTAGVAAGTIWVRLTASTNAGTHAGDVTVNGGGAAALSIAMPASTVARKEIAISAPTIAAKTYDRTTASGVVTVGVLSGLVGADTLTVEATASFPSADVGSYGTTVTYTLRDATGKATNYSLTATAGVTGSITAKAITVADAVTVSRPYDGTTSATITGTLTGVIAGDTVTFNGSGTFANRSAGSGKPVSPTLSLAGSGAGNYVLSQPTGLTGTITPKALTLTGATAQNKSYDGTTSATITGNLTGVVTGDVVAFVGAGTFAQAVRGSGIPVTATLSLYSRTGSAASNYTVNQPTGLTADITVGQQSIPTVTIGTRLVGTSISMPATTSAGQVLTYTTSDASIASVSGNVITFATAGYARIGATAPATADYATFASTQTVKVLASADPVTLVAGDVVVLGYDTAAGSIALLFLRDLTPGTTFFVSDNEVIATGGTQFADLDESEAAFTVKAGQVIAAGTVITLPWQAAGESTTAYDWVVNDANPALDNGGDEVSVYTATSIAAQKPSAFLAAISYGSSPSQRPNGLVDGQTFIRPSGDGMRYKPVGAPSAGSPATLRTAIGNTAVNWESSAPQASDYVFLLPQPQLVTFGTLPSKSYGDQAFALTATAFSGGSVTFASSDPTVASVSGGVVTILKAGSTTITAAVAGDDSYLAAAAAQILTVSRKGITVVADAKSKTYGDADPTLTWVASGLIGGDALGGALTRVPGSEAAAYAISLGSLGNPNYDIAYTGASLTVAPKALTITAGDTTKAGNQTLSGGSGSTAFSATGLVAGETVGTVTIVYGAAAASGTAAGTYPGQVVPSAATGGTFNPSNYAIDYVAGSIVVTSTATISVAPAALAAMSTTYGTGSLVQTFNVAGSTLSAGSLTVSAPAGFQLSQDGSNFASTQTLAIVSGTVNATTIWVQIPAVTAAGTYSGNVTITGGGATEKTVAIAPSTVSPKTLSISGLAFSNKTYDGTTTAPSATAAAFSGLVNGETFTPSGAVSWAFPDKNTAVGKTLVRTGEYAAPSANYTVDQPTRTAGIVAKALAIIADAKSKVFGAADPAFTFASTGLVAGDTLTGNLSRTAGTAVGTYAINQGSLSAGSNYTLAYTPANLTVAKRPVTVTADAVGKVAGQADPALTWKVASSTPLAAGDSVQTAFSGALARAAGEGQGSYAILQGTLDATNYQITFTGASFTITPASSPLKVSGVYVKGSGWAPAYQSLGVFTTIGTTNVGWSLADGAAQLRDGATIGWSNIDTISIRFNQPISAPQAGALSLVFGGSTVASGSTTALGGATLLEGGTVAQWTIPSLATGKYRLVATSALFASAASPSNTLDGEWVAYAGSFAAGSGNGTSGGDFVYDFDVLVGNATTGDVNSSTKAEIMSVNINDNTVVTGQVRKAITALNFRCDVNGSGKIDATDLAIVQARIKAGVAASLTSTYYLDPAGRPRRA